MAFENQRLEFRDRKDQSIAEKHAGYIAAPVICLDAFSTSERAGTRAGVRANHSGTLQDFVL